MSKKFALIGSLFAATLGAATLAQGAANPLDPDYYQGQPAWQAPPQDPTPYVDARNPLNPTFGVERNSFEGAVKQSAGAEPYRDLNNPLYPSYRR